MTSSSVTIVIFGANGDLTKRKLIPSLYSLFRNLRLPDGLSIVGVSRTPKTDEAFRSELGDWTREASPRTFDEKVWATFAQQISYHAMDVTQPAAFSKFEEKLRSGEEKGAGRLYYLSIAPRFFLPTIQELSSRGMLREDPGFRRVIVEKPFGHDAQSAQKLNEELHAVMNEDQIYRIDHYLGKETVQNLLVLRFGNSIFEPLWNRRYIDHVQITVSETDGIGDRGGYYDRSGALRDMVQSHLLQVLTLVAMEPPTRFEPEALRNEKVKVLQALRFMDEKEVAEHTVRGQYRGYLDEKQVEKKSQTATYVALQAYLDNWRWQGVPFFLRTGKNLAKRVSKVDIVFRCPPQNFFIPSEDACGVRANRLTMILQPHEGFHLQFETKVPGQGMITRSEDMEFHYDEAFGKGAIPNAYERLLLDGLQGDASLFTRADELVLAWEWVDQIRKVWEERQVPQLVQYDAGTRGPKEADELMEKFGSNWMYGSEDH